MSTRKKKLNCNRTRKNIYINPTSFNSRPSQHLPKSHSQPPITLLLTILSPPGSTKTHTLRPTRALLNCMHQRPPFSIPQYYLHFYTRAATATAVLLFVFKPELNPEHQMYTDAFTSTLLPLTSTAMNAANLTLSSLGGCGGCGSC